ncbi:MAG: protein kinase [Deltaproteobacteria bacterium]|jgi:serine/threonine protein kinase|nr:protein kinase [Deltaproteobacteria bacterium]
MSHKPPSSSDEPKKATNKRNVKTVRDSTSRSDVSSSTVKDLQQKDALTAPVGEALLTEQVDSPLRSSNEFNLKLFRGLPITQALPAKGAEADLFIVQRDDSQLALRLYRKGFSPKPELSRQLAEVSGKLANKVCQIFEYGYDLETGRHYELQEFFSLGDLDNYLRNGNKVKPGAEFLSLVKSLKESISALHSANIVHRDLKPANILLRSIEPLRVALSDFGISSVMLDGQSIKETQRANTPYYSAPEAFSDLAGEAGDYWSMGVVLLESLLGKHPWEGLSLAMVIREVTTRGFTIPPEIPEREAFLLKGLLTRDDKKRWRSSEVARWLLGHVRIPLFFEADLRKNPKKNVKKYTFNNKKYSTLKGLATEMASSYEAWELGVMHYSRGNIRNWLESIGRQDDVAQMELFIKGTPDQQIFQFILRYAPKLGYAWKGGFLDLDKIAASLVRSKLENTSGEEAVLQDIQGHKLKDLISFAEKNNLPFSEELIAILNFNNFIDRESLLNAILALSNPNSYVFGNKNFETITELIEFCLNVKGPLLSVDYWRQNVPIKRIVPPDIISDLENSKSYSEGQKKLFTLIASGAFKESGIFYRYTTVKLRNTLSVRVGKIPTEEYLFLFRSSRNGVLTNSDNYRFQNLRFSELEASFLGLAGLFLRFMTMIGSIFSFLDSTTSFIRTSIAILWIDFTFYYLMYILDIWISVPPISFTFLGCRGLTIIYMPDVFQTYTTILGDSVVLLSILLGFIFGIYCFIRYLDNSDTELGCMPLFGFIFVLCIEIILILNYSNYGNNNISEFFSQHIFFAHIIFSLIAWGLFSLRKLDWS